MLLHLSRRAIYNLQYTRYYPASTSMRACGLGASVARSRDAALLGTRSWTLNTKRYIASDSTNGSAVSPPYSYQLLSTAEKAGPKEDQLYHDQVKKLERKWASPRYEGVVRPYKAEDVVAKRGTLPQTYPSSLMATKLFNLLQERAREKEPVHTSGPRSRGLV